MMFLVSVAEGKASTARAGSLAHATSELAKLAAERGGKDGDNVTIAIARIGAGAG